jgi:hypothetical protein
VEVIAAQVGKTYPNTKANKALLLIPINVHLPNRSILVLSSTVAPAVVQTRGLRIDSSFKLQTDFQGLSVSGTVFPLAYGS